MDFHILAATAQECITYSLVPALLPAYILKHEATRAQSWSIFFGPWFLPGKPCPHTELYQVFP